MIGNIASTIAKDGKEAITTTALLFTHIGRLTIAVRTLYRVSQQFPGIVRGARALGQELMKYSAVRKVVESVQGALSKLAKTEGFKNVVATIAAPVIVKGLLLIATAGAIAAAAMAKFFLSRAKAAADVKDMANLVDVTTQLAQGLKRAAEAARLDPGKLVGALSQIQEAQAKAFTGSDKQIAAFQRLGFSIEDLKKMSPHEIFQKISRDVQSGKITNLAAMLTILGDDARTLLPAMKNGIADLNEEFQNLAINRNVLDTLDEADQKWQKIKTQIKGVTAIMASGIAAGGFSLVKRATALLNLIAQAGANANPMGGQFWRIGKAWENYGNAEAQSILMGDDDFAASKENESRLEGELKRKQLIQAEDKKATDELRKKNDEMEREVALSEMSLSQRKMALEAERDALRVQMDATKSERERQEIREKLLDVEGQLARTNPRASRSETVQQRNADQYTRVGIVRAGSNAAIGLMRQQNLILQRQVVLQQRHLERLNRIISGQNTTNSHLTADA